jgi:hypothetical protein
MPFKIQTFICWEIKWFLYSVVQYFDHPVITLTTYKKLNQEINVKMLRHIHFRPVSNDFFTMDKCLSTRWLIVTSVVAVGK